MKKFIAIFACKIVRFIGKLMKRGSSLPGEIALRIDPDILSKISLPKYVIAVSGSNGKTSTVEMIKAVLEKGGFRVAFNYEGSNQIEGVTTLILSDCSLNGVCKSDVILMESDERYARHTFRYITPTHFVITNLYRDQLTRNGNPEIIFKCLKESIKRETNLIVNGDDPLVSLLADGHNLSSFYGIDNFEHEDAVGIYDDGVYCPKCKKKFKYAYRHYSNIGSYECKSCGYKHPNLKYHITSVNLNKGELIIDNDVKIHLALKSLYNAYNILATYSLCKELGVHNKIISNTLNDYVLKNGRVTKFVITGKEGTLLTSKHENSISYNQSLTVVRNEDKDITVLVLVDAISRKYFTSETSWLWDIDFNLLNSPNVKKIVLAGQYANDLALRFEYSDVDQKLIYVEKNIQEAINYIASKTNNYVYVVTCFSDMQKVLSRVEVIK